LTTSAFPTDDLFLDRLAARIRAARIEAKLTLEELAVKTRLTSGDLSKIERNELPVGITRLRAIAAGLGRSLHSLFDLEVELPPAARPPEPLDPNYAFDAMEQKLLAAFRQLRGKERRIIYLITTEIFSTRDRRYDFRGRKRRKNLPRPDTMALAKPSAATAVEGASPPPDIVLPAIYKNSPEGKWLSENSHLYPGQWVALREGKLVDHDRNRGVMVRRLRAANNLANVQLAFTDSYRRTTSQEAKAEALEADP
jgi:transcriptional regulator with XRE-family HTH domain